MAIIDADKCSAETKVVVSNNKNLFIELHEAKYLTEERRFGSGWENLFTEQFAFFLSADLPAAAAVAGTLLGGDHVQVVGVSTQVTSKEGTPDLRFDFAGGGHLYVEHKFDSPLGKTQLSRYARLGRVALVSRCNQSIPNELFECQNYVHPPDRHYYHWADVYRALPSRDEAPEGFGALRDHFRVYMRELGLAPINLKSEWRHLFEDRTAPDNQRVQKDFGRLLDGVKSSLRDRGFRVGDVSHMGKQVYSKQGMPWLWMYVTPGIVRADYLESQNCKPFDPGYEALLVEMVFDQSSDRLARATYEDLPATLVDSSGSVWYPVKPQPVKPDRIKVSLATPLAPFLLDDQAMASRLLASALTAVDTLTNAVDRTASETVLDPARTLQSESVALDSMP